MADGSIWREVGTHRPLCFLHIGKTGGTSLSDALGRLYPDDRRFSDGGNITIGYLNEVDASLSGSCFIAGHADRGVVRRLGGDVDFVTLLRRPDHQAVSNYLHILTEPDNSLYRSASRQSFSAFLRENPNHIVYQAISLAVALSTPEAPVDPLDPDGLNTVLDFLDSLAFVGVIDRPEDCCAQLSARLSIDPPLRLAFLNSALCRGVSPGAVRRLLQEYRALASDPELSHLFTIEALLYAKADALLTRSMASLGPAARPPREFTGPVGADRFFSAERSLDAGRYLCRLADAPDRRLAHHLIYGPFHRLGRGGYAVDFHFSLQKVASQGRGRIEIEVLANGAHSLSRRWLQPTAMHRRTLYFSNCKAADVLEFRIRAKGFDGGWLEFHGVTVRRAASYRTWPSLIGALVRRAARSIVRVAATVIAPRAASGVRRGRC